MVKYLVTGGCGFIGRHLVEELIKKGFGVRILDDLSNSKLDGTPKDAELILGSVTDPNQCKEALDGVDGCFHLAAISSVEKSVQYWSSTHAVNSGGLVQLFEAVKNRPIPMIYASSAAVYGDGGANPLSEEAPLSPLSPYAADKMACEQQAKIAFQLFGIPNLGFRFFNVYGPRQELSPYAGIITILSQKISEGKAITIFGNGEQKRDFIYVGDVVRMLIEAMQGPIQQPAVYNLCTGIPLSINQLAEQIGRLTNREVVKKYAPERKGDIFSSCGNPSKIKRELGLEAKIPLEEGLQKILKIAV